MVSLCLWRFHFHSKAWKECRIIFLQGSFLLCFFMSHTHTRVLKCHDLFISLQNSASSSLLSPPTSTRRRGSSVMFNEFVILHTPPSIPEPQSDKNALSVEKMTQTSDGIWQVSSNLWTLLVEDYSVTGPSGLVMDKTSKILLMLDFLVCCLLCAVATS